MRWQSAFIDRLKSVAGSHGSVSMRRFHLQGLALLSAVRRRRDKAELIELLHGCYGVYTVWRGDERRAVTGKKPSKSTLLN